MNKSKPLPLTTGNPKIKGMTYIEDKKKGMNYIELDEDSGLNKTIKEYNKKRLIK